MSGETFDIKINIVIYKHFFVIPIVHIINVIVK